MQLLQWLAEKFQQFIQVCLFPVPQVACSLCLPFHLLSGQQMSQCFCKLFLSFPASLKWKEWEKQTWSKAKVKWWQRRESLWTYPCRKGGTWTGTRHNPALQSCSANKEFPLRCVIYTSPLYFSVYKNTQISDSLCLLFYKKLSVFPSFGFSDFFCNWFTQWLHTMEPNLSHSWAPECNAKYLMKVNRQTSSLFLFH